MAARKPLYLHLTPATPHKDNNGEGWVPPPPAARHAGLYPGLQLPANPTLRTPNPLIPDTRIDMTKCVRAWVGVGAGVREGGPVGAAIGLWWWLRLR